MRPTRYRLTLAVFLALLAGHIQAANGITPPHSGIQPMSQQRASGSFDVKLNPLEPYNRTEDAKLGRLSIDKQFHGDLEATSQGEMLSAGTVTPGSAGYVAIERVTGTLAGKSGSFVLQHSATLNRGTPTLNISVVPDSGTEGLTGISGTMNIIIEGGKHSYEFDYTLPAAP
jgi:hypothetical protein